MSSAIKPRLSMLRPRLQTGKAALPVLTRTAGVTERLRGRPMQRRRARWLDANPMCAHCVFEGLTIAGQEVDHVVPLWDGGADDESNFQTLCIPHHAKKTAQEAAERARQRG